MHQSWGLSCVGSVWGFPFWPFPCPLIPQPPSSCHLWGNHLVTTDPSTVPWSHLGFFLPCLFARPGCFERPPEVSLATRLWWPEGKGRRYQRPQVHRLLHFNDPEAAPSWCPEGAALLELRATAGTLTGPCLFSSPLPFWCLFLSSLGFPCHSESVSSL